jgi:hypothetical protein
MWCMSHQSHNMHMIHHMTNHVTCHMTYTWYVIWLITWPLDLKKKQSTCCDGLSHGTFFVVLDFLLYVLWHSFSKSKDQVISHVMDHGTSHVMGQVTCHVMANSCIMCTYLVTQLLTERQVLMTHCLGHHLYLQICLLFWLTQCLWI